MNSVGLGETFAINLAKLELKKEKDLHYRIVDLPPCCHTCSHFYNDCPLKHLIDDAGICDGYNSF